MVSAMLSQCRPRSVFFQLVPGQRFVSVPLDFSSPPPHFSFSTLPHGTFSRARPLFYHIISGKNKRIYKAKRNVHSYSSHPLEDLSIIIASISFPPPKLKIMEELERERAGKNFFFFPPSLFNALRSFLTSSIYQNAEVEQEAFNIEVK